METKFEAGTQVKVLSAPDYFKGLVGQVGKITGDGKSGTTQMVTLTNGSAVYLKPSDLEAA